MIKPSPSYKNWNNGYGMTAGMYPDEQYHINIVASTVWQCETCKTKDCMLVLDIAHQKLDSTLASCTLGLRATAIIPKNVQ